MTRTAALLALLALAGCASFPPSVVVPHTVPPKFNIMPAESVAVIGHSDKAVEQHEDNFIDLVVSKLRGLELFDVKDERAFARGINPGHGLFEARDWKTYLD